MSALRFQLFGKLLIQKDARALIGLEARKEQELLCYLLVHPDRPHPREMLANLLWSDTSTEKSRKYLRQALWHLHSMLKPARAVETEVLSAEHDWVQLNLNSDCWIDVTVFERAFAATQGKSLDQNGAQSLKNAVELYKGDLLDGWYHDWCLFERERLQNMYLTMLDKLMTYSMEHQEYETGFTYGSTILRYDRASERTYRQLMLMKYSAGDRTGALRLYDRCVVALAEELAVKPEARTTAIYEKIRTGSIDNSETMAQIPHDASLTEVLGRLKRLQLVLTAVQKRVQRDIAAVEQGFKTLK
ncbi:MAG TPA: BTAD domain-containing putative transcriptional regulator [Pyrinomonadaceae bacterium]|nr:BTAD domain-containing putative transcriptional regulator [Pyrinomonadaceae bacterium]